MNQNLSELICTRLSHDIIGNIGAVSNAVELLEEGDMDFLDDIKSILKLNSQVLSARLKFFRMAFGLSNENLSKQEVLQATVTDYLATLGNRNFPIRLKWETIPTVYARLALLSVMAIADTMIRGGEITVRPYQKGITVFAAEDTAQISAEKSATIKEAINSGQVEDNAQFAPIAGILSAVRKSEIQLYLLSGTALGFVFE